MGNNICRHLGYFCDHTISSYDYQNISQLHSHLIIAHSCKEVRGESKLLLDLEEFSRKAERHLNGRRTVGIIWNPVIMELEDGRKLLIACRARDHFAEWVCFDLSYPQPKDAKIQVHVELGMFEKFETLKISWDLRAEPMPISNIGGVGEEYSGDPHKIRLAYLLDLLGFQDGVPNNPQANLRMFVSVGESKDSPKLVKLQSQELTYS